VCTVRDITDEVEQKRQLETLNYATSELLTTSTETEVAEVAVEIADEVLNHTLAACWRYEPDEDCLRPLAATGAVESMASRTGGSVPDFGSGSYEMEVYKRGEPVLVDDYQSLDAPATDAPLRTVLMLPLGEYGVLHVGSVNRTHITETEQMLMEILARHAEAAFGRARRETQLKERQELLQRQKNRLKRLSETLSHDIRNPLQVASGRLEMLRTDTDSPHAGTRSLTKRSRPSRPNRQRSLW
jgi:GAF domain-containing protein